MDGGYSSVTPDSQPSKVFSSRGLLDGHGGQSPTTESQGSLDSYTFARRSTGPSDRDPSVDPREEDEESEGPLREQDLKGASIQLVRGVQEWQDGCVYQGEFGLNMKLGYGEFSWPTGEAYCGQFYRDHCHGVGTYTWPDGSNFTGIFYLSQREGYGTMYMKEKLFQGLYKADQRFGPGIETYSDGSQDVGLWFREHLLKLGTEAPKSFSLLNYPEFSAFLTDSRERISLSDEEKVEWGPPEEQDPFSYDYKKFLLNDDLTLPPEMHIYSTNNSHLPMTGSLRKELDARIFMNEIPPFIEDGEPWFITNETPLLIKIQKQTYKFRNKRAHTRWNIPAILEGNRSSFGPSGPKEQLSKEMILKAEEGDYDCVYGILRDNLAYADVADSKGYTVLAAAAVHSHHDIVNLLLDFGADVNKCSDEGLTPLIMCFLNYYPSKSFQPNVAERTIPQEPPKFPVTSKISLSGEPVMDHLFGVTIPMPGSEGHMLPMCYPSSLGDGLAPSTVKSRESAIGRSTSHRQDISGKGASSNPEKESENVAENLDASTLYSMETNFESTMCLHNYSIHISKDILEKSAQAYSSLKASSADKGTMRKMAQSMAERRNRWLTIKLLLRRGADPNLCSVPMQALFFAVKAGDVDGVRLLLDSGARTDIQYPPQIDRLINYGADILKPVILVQGEKMAVGTAVDYGYFRFYQDRKIAHCPFHALMPAERETFMARKRLLEYMGVQLRRAVLSKESQLDMKMLYLSKRAELSPSHRMKKSSSLSRASATDKKFHLTFFKFCYQCGRSIGVRLTPCPRCYGILTCGKYCKMRAWADFHKKDCYDLMAISRLGVMSGWAVPRLEDLSWRTAESQ
ncbi:ankyrin repeat and MYND domain-containing protein 1 isoform X5 [Nannospalax galili]|uniref:ankyrin repeat and MYND domain-containing protein 1 isoform X5 n=1 Tax=Nannospalax galili TaxID=1026970 RepID=UPI00111BF259|nr:ankyrin repeat and MYND domain-containing protein 1 isoform X5 [Nannospalax galili]